MRFTPLRMLRRASCGCHSSHYGHHCGTHAPQCGQNGGISARAFSRSTANAIECAEWSNQASTVSTQRRQVGTSTREYAVAAKRWDGSAGHAQSIQRLYGDAANPNSAYSSAIGRALPFRRRQAGHHVLSHSVGDCTNRAYSLESAGQRAGGRTDYYKYSRLYGQAGASTLLERSDALCDARLGRQAPR